MPRANHSLSTDWSLGDLLEHLGDIAPQRVRLHPAPGAATEKDILRMQTRKDRLFELVDGVLVEKIMGYPEAYLAMYLGRLLGNFIEGDRDWGIVSGADSMMRLMPGLVRIPDVAFVSWDKLPGHVVPSDPIPDLVPDLAVEILSVGNTRGEMARKLKDYFLAGVRLVWLIDPAQRRVQVYTAPDERRELVEKDTLDGGEVLPGFTLPLKQLFAKIAPAAGQSTPRQAKGKRK